jgi:hypothetical protein
MQVEDVLKYHRTFASYINSLIDAKFQITRVLEPAPSEEMLSKYDDMKDELRRPMFLVLRSEKD